MGVKEKAMATRVLLASLLSPGISPEGWALWDGVKGRGQIVSLKQTLDSRALLQSMLELSNYNLELLEEIRQLLVLTLL